MREYFNRGKVKDGYEKSLLDATKTILIENFNKVAKWIEENCPNLNGRFKCELGGEWIALVVENGKAYLEKGEIGHAYEIALSTTETARFTRGSVQEVGQSWDNQFFPNYYLEKFLKEWQSIKKEVIAENELQEYVHSKNFKA